MIADEINKPKAKDDDGMITVRVSCGQMALGFQVVRGDPLLTEGQLGSRLADVVKMVEFALANPNHPGVIGKL